MRDGLQVALFEPDRPHNLGMMLRLGACLDVAVDVIEPCGFPLDDRRIRFGALDYLARVEWCRHQGCPVPGTSASREAPFGPIEHGRKPSLPSARLS